MPVSPAVAAPAAVLGGAVRVHDLGPLVVDVDEVETPLRGAIPARILTRLLVNANRRVSVDALLDAVWGGQISQSTPSTLESHIWRLRKLLEPGRGRWQQPTYLVNDANGYRLVANPDSADSLRFAQLSEQGHRLLATGDPSRALDRYELALTLWRGRPFSAVADEEWAAAPIARLEEQHEQVQEQRVAALLELGAVGRALSELAELVGRFPLRERLWELMMLGLYRAGRPNEALETYQRARSIIRESLGIEPGDALRTLHARILDRDPALVRPTAGSDDQPHLKADRPPTGVTRGVHLPATLSALVGRDFELARLTTLLGQTRLTTLVGTAGCGKTRLAVETARSAASLALDGVWFVDLTTTDDPAAVADVIAAAINVERTPIGGVKTALSSYVADRQIFLVLDNCEHVLPGVYDVLESLLADASQCRILATSREPIGFDGEVLWTLAPLPVRDPSTATQANPSPAAELFLARARSADPLFAATDDDLVQIEAICSAVDGIPLAIELAAGRLRSASLTEVRQQVATELVGLSGPGYARTKHHRTVEAAIDWSVQRLQPTDRSMHRVLSVLPGVFTQEAAQAVAVDGSPRQVSELLTRLVHCSLLAVVPPSSAGEATRFRQLATVRAHASEDLMATDNNDGATRERRQQFVEALVAARPAAGAEDDGAWFATIEANFDTMAAVLQDGLVDRPSPTGVRLVAQLTEYWFYRGRITEGMRWLELSLTQADADPTHRAQVELALAYMYALGDRTDRSVNLVRSALSISPPQRRPDLHAYAYALVAAAWCMSVRQDTALAFVDEEVRRLDPDDPFIAVWADVLTARNGLDMDGPAVTSARAAELVTRALELECLSAAWLAAWLDVLCAFITQRAAAGQARLEQVNELYRRLGGGPYARAVEFEGNFAALARDPARATRLFGIASRLAFTSGLSWPVSPVTQDVLRQVKQDLTVEQFNAAWRAGDSEARTLR